MKLAERALGPHPSGEYLALFARGDLPRWTAWQVRRHVRECAQCEQQAALFKTAVAELKREARDETLTAFEAIADWGALEREMLGNVVVGLAAARCIENVGMKRAWLPKVALGAGLSALFAAGWVTHIPREQNSELAGAFARYLGLRVPQRAQNVVQTTANGIAVRSEGVTLTMLHPASAHVAVSGKASVEARYVDEDTGQLTITNVYGQ